MSTIGGLVYTEDEPPEFTPLIGDTIDVYGRDHVIVGKTAHYEVEKDRWELAIKLEPLREPELVKSEYSDPPEWMENVIHERRD